MHARTSTHAHGGRRRRGAVGGLGCIAALLCLWAGLAQSLVVTRFPHFQTFDSWDQCNYPGTCYEQVCASFPAGWSDPPAEEVPFANQTRGWWVIEGPTSSNLNLPCSELLTGPCSDHTGKGGKYAYAESSGCYGSEFEFTGPTVMFTAHNATVSFYYYMYGADMDSSIGQARLALELLALNASSPAWTVVVEFVGQQQKSPGAPWGSYRTFVDSYLPAPASTAAPMAVQFRFRAVTAGKRGLTSGTKRDFWMSDIAIDDVLFTQSGAPNTTKPYIDPGSQTSPTPTPSPTTSSGGLDDKQIAAIVAGTAGGLILLALLLLGALIALLLLISPRRKLQKIRGGSSSSESSSAASTPRV